MPGLEQGPGIAHRSERPGVSCLDQLITYRQISKKQPGKEHRIMDAIIGRYRVRLEEDGLLVLKHPSGICFDLAVEETLGFLDFVGVYRTALLAISDQDTARDTEPELPRMVLPEQSERDD